MGKVRIELCDKAIIKFMKKYFKEGKWKSGECSTKENLLKFKGKIDESLRILVLLRCTNSDIVGDISVKSEYSDESEKEIKNLRDLDNKLFHKQLADLARIKKGEGTFSCNNEEDTIEIKGDCIFKRFQKHLDDLVYSDEITVEKLKNLKNSTVIVLNSLLSYQRAKAAEAKSKSEAKAEFKLHKVKFWKIFIESVQNFKQYIEKISKNSESGKITQELTQKHSPKTELRGERSNFSETYEQEDSRRVPYTDEYGGEDEDTDGKGLELNGDMEEGTEIELSNGLKFISFENTEEKEKEKVESVSEGKYNFSYLLCHEICEKTGKGLSLEEKIQCVKDTILHATACFIGACKYAKLECKRLYDSLTIKIYRDRGCLHLSEINWKEDFIKSLNKIQEWRNLKDDINAVYGVDIWSYISKEQSLEDLIHVFSDYFYDYGFVVAPDDENDEVTQDMKDESINYEIVEGLRKGISDAVEFFSSQWSTDVERYLKKLISIREWDKTAENIEENEKVNNKKRDKIMKDKVKNEAIYKELKPIWNKNKNSVESPDTRKTLAETIKAANEAHEKLKKRGILFETDNSRGTNKTVQGYSQNFAKLFIRYLERSFPELEKYVKIYFYANPVKNCRGEDSKISDKYWRQVDYYKSKSKSDGMTYFIVNQIAAQGKQEGPSDKLSEDQKRLAKGNKLGHGNLTVICNGKYKVFETVEGVESIAIGKKNFGKEPIMSGVTIQADDYNCLAISLGYLESILKQLSREVKNKNKELEKEKLKNKENPEELKKEKEELDKKSRQGIIENMGKEINRFSTVVLPSDIFSLNKITTKSMGILLPTKYIKYLQSRSRIEQLLKYIRGIEKNNKDYDILQEVKNELERVTQKYTPLNEPIKSLLGDMESWDNGEKVKKILDNKSDVLKEAGLDVDKVTLSQLIQKIDDACEMMGVNGGKCRSSVYTQRIVNVGIEGMELEDIEKKLKSNPILKLCVDDPLSITVGRLYELKNFSDSLKAFSRINLRAQMKRRTEILKVATLVEALDNADVSIADEIDAVRDFSDN